MNIIFFIIILVIVVGFTILVVVLNFLRNIFRFGRRQGRREPDPFSEENRTDFNQAKQNNKIIEKTEGEYVDFEEIDE